MKHKGIQEITSRDLSPPAGSLEAALARPFTVRFLQPILVAGPLGQGKQAMGTVQLTEARTDPRGLLFHVGAEYVFVGWSNVASINLQGD